MENFGNVVKMMTLMSAFKKYFDDWIILWYKYIIL